MLLALSVGCESNGQIDVTPTSGTCEPIDYTMASICEPLQTNYNNTAFPNLRNDEKLEEAVGVLGAFTALIESNCSAFTRDFLCSYHIPPCFPIPNTDLVLRLEGPCRNLCEKVYNSCIDLIIQQGEMWPEQLNCSLFPEPNGECYGPQADTTTVSLTSSMIAATTTQSRAPDKTTRLPDKTTTTTTAVRTPAVTPTLNTPREPDLFEGNTATSISTCIYVIVSALVTALYLPM